MTKFEKQAVPVNVTAVKYSKHQTHRHNCRWSVWWNLAQFVARILGWGVTLKIMCKIYGGVIPKKLGWIGELVWKSSKLSHNGHRKCTPTPPSRVIIHQPLKRSAFILDHRFKLLNITYPILCSQSPAVWFFGLALTTLLRKRNTALEMTIYIP